MGRTAGARAQPAWRRQYVPLEWMDAALCRQTDSELFFPTSGQSGMLRRAKAVCRQCPVIAECFEWAVDDPSMLGVLGGTSERDRMKIRKQRREQS